MRGRPPKAALDFWLSSLASPRVTSRNSSSLTRMHRVLAIWPGSTPCTSAASCTVAVEASVTSTTSSGARAARSAWTDWRLIRSLSEQRGKFVFVFGARLVVHRGGEGAAHEGRIDVAHAVHCHQFADRDALALIALVEHRCVDLDAAGGEHAAIGAGTARPMEPL